MRRTIINNIRVLPLFWKDDHTSVCAKVRQARLVCMFKDCIPAENDIHAKMKNPYVGMTFINEDGWACIVIANLRPRKKPCVVYCEDGHQYRTTENDMFGRRTVRELL